MTIPAPATPPVRVSLTVNGRPTTVDVDPRTLLVEVLRDRLGLTGTHVGCDTNHCGACVVHLNGDPVKACAVLAVQADGARVLTIEGVAADDALHPLQQAFRTHHALQCGFCTPGMVMTALALLARQPSPSDAEIRAALAGNLCRCTGYQPIIAAIRTAAAALRATA